VKSEQQQPFNFTNHFIFEFVATLGPGSVVGEMAFLLGETTADVVGDSETIIAHRLERFALEHLLQTNPGLCLRFYQVNHTHSSFMSFYPPSSSPLFTHYPSFSLSQMLCITYCWRNLKVNLLQGLEMDMGELFDASRDTTKFESLKDKALSELFQIPYEIVLKGNCRIVRSFFWWAGCLWLKRFPCSQNSIVNFIDLL
jgi:hypothetical protein